MILNALILIKKLIIIIDYNYSLQSINKEIDNGLPCEYDRAKY
jgi:hypothetical protein